MSIILLSIILLQGVAPSLPFTKANSLSSTPSIKLKHAIQVEDDGNLVLNDTITLRNNTTTPISSLQIGFDKSFTANLDHVIALTTEGKELSIAKNITLGNTNIYWLNVSFNPATITPNTAYNFSVIFAFSGLFDIRNSSSQIYGFIFPKYPALIWNVESCEVDVTLPRGVSFVGSSWGSLNHVEAPLKAYSNETGYTSFNGSIQLIKGVSAEREITLDGYGNAFFYDSYTLRNVGLTSISKMGFTIPKDSEVLDVYDSFGPLTFTANEGGVENIVNVTFRYPLRGKEDSTAYYYAYNLTIKYNLKQSPIKQESWNNYQIRTKLFANTEWTIQALVVKIILPEGATFIESSVANNDLSKNGLTQSVIYTVQDVTPINNLDVIIRYQYIILWSAFRPTLLIGMIIAIIGIPVIYCRRTKKSPSKTISRENVKLISAFLEACDEKMTLETELRDLEKDLEDDGIRKKDYNRRRSVIDQHLRLATKQSTGLKEKIKQLEPRYSELIKKIEAAEAEIKNLDAEISKIGTRYRSRDLTRNAYEKLRDSYEKKIDKIKVGIEGIIIELKGEAG